MINPSHLPYRASTLEELFSSCFRDSDRTALIGGADEPLYVPAITDNPDQLSQIHYTHDYFRSALHEIAHWCVAGPERRLLTDYGYWYAPDGRDASQQAEFEQMEVYPQALELIFCAACGLEFRVSLDNLGAESLDARPFQNAVYQKALLLLSRDLRRRTDVWVRALVREYRGDRPFSPRWIDEVMKPWS